MAELPAWARDRLAETNSSRPASVIGSSAPSSAYGAKALEDECHKVATAAVGTRNATLNAASFSLAQLVAGGCLDEATVRRRLEGAAIACGLDADEIGPTIDSGFAGGIANPRAPPQSNGNGASEEAAEEQADAQFAKQNGAAHAHSTKGDAPGSIDPSQWEGLPVPPRVWTVENLIPSRNVTMLNGDGGIGKTLLDLQLGASAARHWSWLGIPTQPGRVLGVFCEDEEDELHRRLVDIAQAMGCRLSDLADFRFVSRVGKDNALVSFGRDHKGKPTPLFNEIGNTAKDRGCNIVMIDALHDVFEGDEINRSEARQFVGHLRSIAIAINGAVVINAHPSQSGLSTGSGTSGSTAWNNACRSRLYLTRPERDKNSKADADDGVRLLQTMKSNYGPLGAEIELRWEHGVFVRTVQAGDPFHEAEVAFMDCLDEASRQGRYVSEANTSTRYAPRVFAKMRGLNRKRNERQLAQAMEALFQSRKIVVGSVRRDNRHSTTAIVRASW